MSPAPFQASRPSGTSSALIPIPTGNGSIVAAPEQPGPGNWVGAPAGVWHDGSLYVAYRIRRPVSDGRGGETVVARLDEATGELVRLCVIGKQEMDAESLERPALVVLADGTWQLYLSCATPGTKHWRVELLEAPSPDAFDATTRRTVMQGSDLLAEKDPVVLRHPDGGLEAWICCHPLDDPDATDRMWTAYATSPDGREWSQRTRVLAPEPGRWDSRGTRVSAIAAHGDGRIDALYDGRATAAENFEERTGQATGSRNRLTVVGSAPVADSAEGGRGLRYAALVATPDRWALLYEAALADGSHDLRLEWIQRA